MADAPRVYWDACVFLSYVNELEGRVENIDALFEEGRQKRIEIVTSSISITEVSFGALEQGALDPATDAKIDKLWMPPSPVQVVEFYRPIAYRAKELVRRGLNENRKLKPMDAIHLGTALQLDSQELNTYDGDLLRWNPHVPELLIRQPIATSPQLPTTGRSGAFGESPPTS